MQASATAVVHNRSCNGKKAADPHHCSCPAWSIVLRTFIGDAENVQGRSLAACFGLRWMRFRRELINHISESRLLFVFPDGTASSRAAVTYCRSLDHCTYVLLPKRLGSDAAARRTIYQASLLRRCFTRMDTANDLARFSQHRSSRTRAPPIVTRPNFGPRNV